MAYVVGLMATDGCLITGRKQLNFKTEDEQLMRTFLRCLGRPERYSSVRTRTGNIVYVIQFGDVRFYDWLRAVGLTPRKSLVLGEIPVPDGWLAHLLRGLIDGDGHIENFVHRPTPSTYPHYSYERLWVYFNSASRRHVEWIRCRVQDLYGLDSYLETQQREGRNDFFRLKFGKRASIALLSRLYPAPDVPKLERKWKIWRDYARRNLVN